jgi:hypothetical protein
MRFRTSLHALIDDAADAVVRLSPFGRIGASKFEQSPGQKRRRKADDGQGFQCQFQISWLGRHIARIGAAKTQCLKSDRSGDQPFGDGAKTLPP